MMAGFYMWVCHTPELLRELQIVCNLSFVAASLIILLRLLRKLLIDVGLIT